MKRFFLMSCFLAVATAEPVVVRFSVPFDFVADNHRFAAGEYAVRSDTIASNVMLQSKTEPVHFLNPGILGSDTKTTVPWVGKLTFHKYGDRYYLHSFQRAGETAREWPASKAEKEAAKANQKTEIAMLAR